MCTVTYFPKGKDHFLFASNRDETPKRAAQEVVLTMQNGKQLLYPRDTGANGTWIAVSDSNQLVCILNGGVVKHKHQPPYRLSRGIMALAFFDYKDVAAFTEHFDFKGIEPFTMVIYDKGKLFTLYWDERVVDVRDLDPTVRHLWSSCTLYPPAWQQRRQQWFGEWAANVQVPSREDLQTFHLTGGSGDPEYDLVMNRQNIVRTTSITSLEKTSQAFKLDLLQLTDNSEAEYTLTIKSSPKE